MIDSGDREHSDQIQANSSTNCSPAPAYNKNSQAGQMKNYKRKAADPIDAINISYPRGNVSCMIVRIKPLNEKSNKEVRVFVFH